MIKDKRTKKKGGTCSQNLKQKQREQQQKKKKKEQCQRLTTYKIGNPWSSVTAAFV